MKIRSGAEGDLDIGMIFVLFDNDKHTSLLTQPALEVKNANKIGDCKKDGAELKDLCHLFSMQDKFKLEHSCKKDWNNEKCKDFDENLSWDDFFNKTYQENNLIDPFSLFKNNVTIFYRNIWDNGHQVIDTNSKITITDESRAKRNPVGIIGFVFDVDYLRKLI